MKSFKLTFHVFLIFLFAANFSSSICQTNKNPAKESNFCKPLNKKIIRIGFTFLAFGKIEKESPDSYEELTYKKEEADESVGNGTESQYVSEDQISDVKISCEGNSFSASYVAYKDEQGNSGLMTITGSFSKDGKMVENCKVVYEGYPGTGKYRKVEHRYTFEVKNIPSEKIPDTWKRTYTIDNFETKTDIFSNFKYYEKKYNGTDYYSADNMLSVDQGNQSNRFAITFYYVK
jgi:hypothetical protein